MISFRPIDLDKDYATLEEWWKGHGALAVPRIILPKGLIAFSAGVDIAASFLYAVEGKIGVIEWTTTNPKCAMSPDLVEAVKGLYLKLEAESAAMGCSAMMSFVEPNKGEERMMLRMGYKFSPDAKMHRIVAKPVGGKF